MAGYRRALSSLSLLCVCARALACIRTGALGVDTRLHSLLIVKGSPLLCVCVFPHVYACKPPAHSAYEGQERMSDSPELQLQIVVSTTA